MQGTIIGIPFFAFLRSSANWEEAGEFRPERFLEKDAEIARKTCREDELTIKPSDPADQTGRQMAKALSDADLDRYESLTLPPSQRLTGLYMSMISAGAMIRVSPNAKLTPSLQNGSRFTGT
jgi:hypothetical protein